MFLRRDLRQWADYYAHTWIGKYLRYRISYKNAAPLRQMSWQWSLNPQGGSLASFAGGQNLSDQIPIAFHRGSFLLDFSMMANAVFMGK